MVQSREMDERARRIVDIAIELAEQDGFQAVRLRDVAAQANVALGTVYKRFRSKEEILLAALDQQAERLREKVRKKPPAGDSPLQRVTRFFETATRTLVRRPKLARALIRSIATGGPAIHDQVASFHALVTVLIVGALRGESPEADAEWGGDADAVWRRQAHVLQQVWFASMVGWAGGLHDEREAIRQVHSAAELLLAAR